MAELQPNMIDTKDQEIHEMEKLDQDVVDVIDPRFDAVFEKKYVRKLDTLLMPTAMLLYLFSALDRGNLGNVRLLGLIGTTGLPLDPKGNKYALFVAMFYVGYSLSIIPAGLISRRFSKPYAQVSISAFIWGTSAVCSGAIKTWPEAYIVRLFLAIGEAGYQPCVALMLAKWYQRDELAFRFSLFYCTGAVSGCINGLIAYGLSFSKGSVAPWRLLFFIDGAPTLVLALWAWYSLPADIHNSKRFTAEEQEFATVRLQRRATPEGHAIKWRQMITVLWSWPIILPAICNMCSLLVGAVVSIFLPTLIKQAGYSGALAQLYTLPAYGSALIAMLVCSRLADKTQRRGPFVIFGFSLMTLGTILIATVSPSLAKPHRDARYAGLCLVTCGSFVLIPLIQIWVAENAGNENRRSAGLPLTMAVGQAASAASGYMFPENEGPAFKSGSYGCLGLAVTGLVVSIVYVSLCVSLNNRRDKLEGKPDPSAVPDTATYADKAPGFRYRW